MESIRPRAGEEIVFAVVSGDPMARVSLSRVCAAIGERTGRPTHAELIDSYGQLSERVAAGELHVAWAPPLMVQSLAQRRLAKTVACPRRQGGLAYHAALFTRARSRFRTAPELVGARAAWVDSASLSGYVVARRWLQQNGIDPERMFAKQTKLKTHSAVSRAVIGGEADVGATYANLDPSSGGIANAGWSEIGAGEGDVHVIATIGPVPADSIVVSTRVPEPMREQIAAALCSLGGSALAAVRVLFRAERFERPPPGYLPSLEQLVGNVSSEPRSPSRPAKKP
jgi:ABC-type phosphate/phosphonate transport system substrate-binding protein